MLNIDENLRMIYKKDTLPTVHELAHKELIITFPNLNLTISNDKIVADSFSLEESLCSDTDLTFGACESAQLKITVADVNQDLKGQLMVVTQVVNGTYQMPLGTYTVESAKKQSDMRFKDIIAYDRMRKFDIDVSAWYNGLIFPLSLRDFRLSLCSHIGIVAVEQTLPNDTMQVTKTISPKSLSGRDVLRRIAEINGSFGHITRDNKLKLVGLSNIGLYPSETLYPAEDMFPSETNEFLGVAGYKNSHYEEYEVQSIDKLQIRAEEGDVGVIVGDGSNAYIIEGNFLVFGKGAEELTTIANNLFLMIKNKKYRPHVTNLVGLPYIEVGDAISIVTTTDVIESFVLKRTLSGIQVLNDEISASGSEQREQNYGVQSQIEQLKGKAAILKRTVEELSSEIIDLESRTNTKFTQTADAITAEANRAGLAEASLSLKADQIQTNVNNLADSTNTRFSQTADAIIFEANRASQAEEDLSSQIIVTAQEVSSKVSKGSIISEINQSAEQITLSANRLVVNSTNFKLSSAGDVEMTGELDSVVIEGAGIKLIPDDATTVVRRADGTVISARHGITSNDGRNIMVFGQYGIYANAMFLGDTTIPVVINGATPITNNNMSLYSYPPESHYQNSTTIIPVTTGAGNVGLSGLNVASVNWCNDTFQPKTSSDMRLKYDIKPISKAKEFILGIKTKLFRFKDQTEDQKQHSGVLAQELLSLMDSLGIDSSDSGLVEEYAPRSYKDEGMYGESLLRVNYTELLPYCISVIQEQDAELKSVKSELAELKTSLIERGVI